MTPNSFPFHTPQNTIVNCMTGIVPNPYPSYEKENVEKKFDFYISGPMTGRPNWNYDAFNKVAKILRKRGFTVFNPAEIANGEQGFSREYYMLVDIQGLLQCKNIVLLNDWQASKGAKIEAAIAQEIGIPFYGMGYNNQTSEYMEYPIEVKTLHADFENSDNIRDIRSYIGIINALNKKDVDDGIALQNIEITMASENGDYDYPTWDESEYPILANNVWFPCKPKKDAIEEPKKLGTNICSEIIPESPPNPETICQEADRLVSEDRQSQYGHPITNFADIGRIWGTLLGTADIPPHMVGLMMVGLKLAREKYKPGRDNRVDGCGYFKTVDMIHNFEKSASEENHQ